MFLKKQYCIYILIALFSLQAFSQTTKRKKKYECIGGIGLAGFLGDLGGSYGNGTHFVKDYNILASRYCLNAGVRYKNVSSFGGKAMLSTAMVSGDDALSKDRIRQNRNLNFRSPIIELSVQGEYYFVNEKKKNVYTLKGLRSTKKKSKLSAYLFCGIGVFYYSPAERLNGTWYNVKKYHVEGQGLPGGPKQFSNFNVAIPIGLGYRQALDKRWSIGVEFGYRKTFTDYIDGVSRNYYNSAKLAQAYGQTAALLADPNLGKIDGATNAGQERGNPKYKDSYMFLTVNIGYMLSSKQHRTRAKF